MEMNTRRLRSAKIVATLGPSSSTPQKIRDLFEAGVDVFRLNFSHGTHEDHRARFAAIRSIETATGAVLHCRIPKSSMRYARGLSCSSMTARFGFALKPAVRTSPILYAWSGEYFLTERG